MCWLLKSNGTKKSILHLAAGLPWCARGCYITNQSPDCPPKFDFRNNVDGDPADRTMEPSTSANESAMSKLSTGRILFHNVYWVDPIVSCCVSPNIILGEEPNSTIRCSFLRFFYFCALFPCAMLVPFQKFLGDKQKGPEDHFEMWSEEKSTTTHFLHIGPGS